jgi:HAMP domain-containing protein
MTESQLDRIKKAEEAVRELVELAAQIRQEAAKLPIDDPAMRIELLETAEGFETQAQDVRNALKEWREDIH